MDVALRLFGTQGILATTTADVAEAAGVSHGTVFLHFPTREALITSVIQTFGEAVTVRMHQLSRAGAGLRETLRSHLARLREHEAFYTRLVMEGAVLPQEARTTQVVIQSALALHLSEAADGEGSRIRKIPMHMLFNTWVSLVHYYLANADLFAPGGSVLERRGDELVDTMMGLLRR